MLDEVQISGSMPEFDYLDDALGIAVGVKWCRIFILPMWRGLLERRKSEINPKDSSLLMCRENEPTASIMGMRQPVEPFCPTRSPTLGLLADYQPRMYDCVA